MKFLLLFLGFSKKNFPTSICIFFSSCCRIVQGLYLGDSEIELLLKDSSLSLGIMSKAEEESSNSMQQRVKFSCSFGGIILPRPPDGKLRYVEGETRLKGIFRFTSPGLWKMGESCSRLLKLALEPDYSIDITSGLKSVATHCVQLQELSLKFRRGDLRELSGLSTLIALRIETDQCDHQYSVASIAAIKMNLKELVYYNNFAPLNDVALTVIIQNCRNLEKLCLSASLLMDSALLCIMECKALKSLALDYFSSEGQGLPAIGLCRIRLKEFSLAYANKVRDVDLEILMYSNKQMERVHLKYCSGPSSKGFSTINLCSNLQSLDRSAVSGKSKRPCL